LCYDTKPEEDHSLQLQQRRLDMRLNIPKPPYPKDIAASLEKWMGGAQITTPEIFEAFHVHPELASRTGVLGAGFLGHCLMSVRDREIVIDRVTGKHGAAHEWGLHATVFGHDAGLTEAQLDSTVNRYRASSISGTLVA
jgi:hypothetical protein